MNQFNRMNFQSGFGGGFGAFTKKLIKFFAVIYVIELILLRWFDLGVIQHLFLLPVGNGFMPWQPVTHLFLQNPASPVPFLFQILFLWFFSGTLEEALGQRQYIVLFFLTGVLAAILGVGLTVVPEFHVSFTGLAAVTSGLFAAFCLMYPTRIILLFFILPVQTKFLLYAFIALEGLSLLAKSNPHASYHLAGIAVAYLYINGYFNWLRLEALVDRIQLLLMKRGRRFTVVSGEATGSTSNVH